MGLGEKVGGTLQTWTETAIGWILDVVFGPLEHWLVGFSDRLADGLSVGSVPGEHALLTLGYDGSAFGLLHDDINRLHGVNRWMARLTFTIGATIAAISHNIAIPGERARQDAARVVRPFIPTADEATVAKWRGAISSQQCAEIRTLWGYDNAEAAVREEALRPWLDLGSILAAWKRGTISEGACDDLLEGHGYRGAQRQVLKDLASQLPGIQDLIAMAVREAFSPDVIDRFGLHKDFPAEFGQEAARQGLSEKWAKAYWASHWELPSLTSGYEMFHRRIIKKADLELLMRTQDVMPFWRDKLMQLSYSPVTRVDIRRLYGAGIWGREDVYNAHLDIGYSPENAEALTAFVVGSLDENARDLSRADILDAYKAARVKRPQALEWLMDLGYSTDEAGLLLAQVDYKLAVERQDRKVKTVKTRYMRGEISAQAARVELDKLKIAAEEREDLIEQWIAEKAAKVHGPTVSDLKAWRKKGLIDSERFVDELRKLGVAAEYLELYAQAATSTEGEGAPESTEGAET